MRPGLPHFVSNSELTSSYLLISSHMGEENKVQVSLTLDPETDALLEDRAKRLRISKSAYVRALVSKVLESGEPLL